MSSIPLDSEQLRDYQNRFYDFTESFDRFYSFYGDRGTFFIPRNSKVLVAAADAPLNAVIRNGKEYWIPEKTEQIEGFDYNYWKIVIEGPDEDLIGYRNADYNMGSLVDGMDESLYYLNAVDTRGILTRSPFSWPSFASPCTYQHPAWFTNSFKK